MTQPPVLHPEPRTLAVCVIGAGAIGRAVADALEGGHVPGATLTAILRSRSTADEIAAALDASNIVVEATTVEAARKWIPRVTHAGKDIVVCSCGVFAESDSTRKLLGRGPGRVVLPSGALGGLDILAAAARAGTDDARLRHVTVKRPSALGIDEPLTEAREVFRGSAREAAIAYPRTSNSSVALSLSTLGLDRVEVVVVADPEAEHTRHTLEWESPIGTYRLTFENAIDSGSPGRTSAITAWSVVEVLAALTQGAGPGAVVLHPTE